jgi:triacylglycerol lipase
VARSEASFALMARSLKTHSYRVQNLEFSTHSTIIAEVVSDTIPQALKAYGY